MFVKLPATEQTASTTEGWHFMPWLKDVFETFWTGAGRAIPPPDLPLLPPARHTEALEGIRRPALAAGAADPRLVELLRKLQGLDPQRSSAARGASIAAMMVLGKLAVAGALPDRIVPTRGGGISFVFLGGNILPGGAHEKYATIDCLPSGEAVTLLGDRGRKDWFRSAQVDDEPVTEDTRLDATIADVQAHIGW